MDARSERTRWHVTVGGAVLLLTVANVMSNRILPTWTYIPWNVLVAVAIVVIARREVSMREMGFSDWARGAKWGFTLFGLTLLVLLVAVNLPAFHDLYDDRRTGATVPLLLYHTLIRIPLGTVLLEETAFRAVLPAVFAVRWGVVRACVAASLLFGVWHVLPALGLVDINPVTAQVFGDGGAGRLVAVTFAVVGTAFAGMWWCWVRYRSLSILSTMIAHVATNSIAYTIAWTVAR
jgi:membrane protease YdiL (CAAX protease family)